MIKPQVDQSQQKISKNIAAARKGGHSDEAIASYLSESDPRIAEAIEGGHSAKDVLQYVSRKQGFEREVSHNFGKLGRAAEAFAEYPSLALKELGVAGIQGLEHLGEAFNPAVQIPGQEKKPTPSEALQSYITENLPEEYKQGAQDIADIEEYILPFLKFGKGKAAIKQAKNAPRTPLPGNPPPGAPSSYNQMLAERGALGAPEKGFAGKPSTKIAETFESGLTKPRAVEAKTPEASLISKGRKARTIEGLEKEAQGLIKQRLEKHAPITIKIQEGFDFEKGYQESFTKLKEAAEKFNPDIDITPLSKFLSETKAKYRGIPEPHADAKSVLSEMKGFLQRVPSDLATLLKIRRSNGRKLNAIYEKRLLEGKRQEYADFLTHMNKKIDEAIQHTLPEDSAWFKEYSNLNKEYDQFKKGQNTLNLLEPILREKMSGSSLARFADNPKMQKRLEIAVGEQGSKEIVQIAKDLKKAKEAIKRMSTDTYKSFNSVFSLGFYLKPVHWARKGYGYYLSTPAKREAFDSALNAISSQNLKAYKEATDKLSSSQ